MPTYKAKEFDNEKIQEIINVHPENIYVLGFKEDWDEVHETLEKNSKRFEALGVKSSWWDTPIMKIYDSNGNFLSEVEVWKEITYETSEENFKLQEALLKDMKERKNKTA